MELRKYFPEAWKQLVSIFKAGAEKHDSPGKPPAYLALHTKEHIEAHMNAVRRHFKEWMDGGLDKDTQCHPLAHVIGRLAIVLELELTEERYPDLEAGLLQYRDIEEYAAAGDNARIVMRAGLDALDDNVDDALWWDIPLPYTTRRTLQAQGILKLHETSGWSLGDLVVYLETDKGV